MLDAHSSIAMGYELLPGTLPPLIELAEVLDRAWEESKHSPRRAGNLIKQWGHPEAGVFAKRASRALVDPPELAQILRSFADDGHSDCKTTAQRFELAARIAKHKGTSQGATWFGFKSTPIDQALREALSPKTHTIMIQRDPRDVWISHQEAGFNASLKEVIKNWNTHAKLSSAPGTDHTTVRYEDLVQDPESTLTPICDRLSLAFEQSMINFEDSKASIFREGLHHVNSPKLKAGLNPSAIGRWKETASKKDMKTIERQCAQSMKSLWYL